MRSGGTQYPYLHYIHVFNIGYYPLNLVNYLCWVRSLWGRWRLTSQFLIMLWYVQDWFVKEQVSCFCSNCSYCFCPTVWFVHYYWSLIIHTLDLGNSWSWCACTIQFMSWSKIVSYFLMKRWISNGLDVYLCYWSIKINLYTHQPMPPLGCKEERGVRKVKILWSK